METVKKLFIGAVSLAAAFSLVFSLKLYAIDGVTRKTEVQKISEKNSAEEKEITQPNNEVSASSTSASSKDNSLFPEKDYSMKETATLKDTEFLRLVNHEHKTDIVDKSLLRKTNNKLHEVREDIYANVVDFLEGAAYYGCDSFINSSFRSLETQKNLYEEAEDSTKKWVAKPGESEHHTGLAIDLIAVAETTGDDALAEQTYAWLENNCSEYGFILRYIKGKEEITGIDYEYWHFRYIGIPHSTYIMDKGLVMEEYIDLLHEKKSLEITSSGKRYRVYAVKPSDGKIPVPVSNNYSVSSDNTGYFIVTEKLGQ